MALDGNHSIGSGGHVDDHNLIDAALASQMKIASGTYVGNQVLNRIISLTFTPKIVFCSPTTSNQAAYIGFDVGFNWAVSNQAAVLSANEIAMVANGFKLLSLYTLNSNSITYQYLAIG